MFDLDSFPDVQDMPAPGSGPRPEDEILAQLAMADPRNYVLLAAEARKRWRMTARAEQLPPPSNPDKWGEWFFWTYVAGRGSGKTRSGGEHSWWEGALQPDQRIAVISPTRDDCRKVCFEGESGLMNIIPRELIKSYNRGGLELHLWNGSMLLGYSAEEPDRLRGPQHHGGWLDELAAWRYLEDTLDMFLFGLRLGKTPWAMATTTPRPIKRLKEILADPTTRISKSSTYANAKNLPKLFLDKIIQRFEGTRLGRQELNAEILDDVPGALWTRANLDAHRILPNRETLQVELPDMLLVVVAVDPATADKSARPDTDEIGIVVVGLGTDGHAYLLADLSMQGSPNEWGEVAVQAFDDFHADHVVYESNQGGEMVRFTIVQCAKNMRLEGKRTSDFVPTKDVWASRGKVTRAEPVSSLYEQGRVHHVGVFAKLEDQMCEFTPNFDRSKAGYSPDRMDAVVWGVTDVILERDNTSGFTDLMRQQAAEARQTKATAHLRRGNDGRPTGITLVAPEGINQHHGMQGHKYTVDGEGCVHNVQDYDVASMLSLGFIHDTEEVAA